MRNKYRFYRVIGLTAMLLSSVAYGVDQTLIDEANKASVPKTKPKPHPKLKPVQKYHRTKRTRTENTATPEFKLTEEQAEQAIPKIEPEMVAITGGCFQMGSPETEPERSTDEKQHQVCVKDFQIGKYEVTQAQWQAVMGDNPSSFKGESLPVENVSWNDVQTFIVKLNEKTGKNYTLPTEAQWEYAARAGTNTAYPWGNVASHDYANYDKDECCDGLVSGKDEWLNTSPVGKFPANAFGLYDMAGNVREWTCSAYVSTYDGSENKCASNNDAKMLRALRGGSWVYTPQNLRSAYRSNVTPDNRINFLGFRLSRM